MNGRWWPELPSGWVRVFWPLQPSTTCYYCCCYCSRSLLDLAFKTTSTTKHTHTIHLTSKQACALLNASKFVALKSYIAATDCASSQQKQQTAARRAAVSEQSALSSRCIWRRGSISPLLPSRIKLNRKVTVTKITARIQGSNFV